MKCEEAFVLAGDAIDRILSSTDAGEFYQHLEHCPRCRRSYEMEVVTKKTLRHVIPAIPTPPEVRAAILLSLLAPQGSAEHLFTRVQKTLHALRFRSLMVFVAASTLFVVFFAQHPRAAGRRSEIAPRIEITHIAAENFQRIRSGELRPAVVSLDPEEIARYFRTHGAAFASSVLPPHRCDWYGAILTMHDGIPLAHVVCHLGDHLLYVFEIQEEALGTETDLHLARRAQERIAQNGWYAEGEGVRRAVVWRDDRTLCAATSTMRPQEMMALLAEL